MSKFKGPLDEFVILIFISLFLLINFDVQVGQIYMGMAFFMALLLIVSDTIGIKGFPIEKKNNKRIVSFMWAITTFALFNFLSNLVMGLSAPKFIGATFSQSPVLEKSTSIAIGTWGVLIPIIETVTFILIMFLIGEKLFRKINFNKPFSIDVVLTTILISLSFGLFHLNVRSAVGTQPNLQLVVTALFMFVSIMLVLFTKQYLEAILLHIIANTLGVLSQFGIGFSVVDITTKVGIVPLLIIGGVIWFIFFRKKGQFLAKTRS